VGSSGARALLTFAAVALFLPSGCGGGENGTAPAAAAAGAGQRSAGGERSVEQFGHEAHAGTRAALLSAFRGYLVAIGAHRYRAHAQSSRQRCGKRWRNWRTTDARTTRGARACFPSCSPRGPRRPPGNRQEHGLPGYASRTTEASSFSTAGARLYLMSLVREASGWKANTATAGVLAPSNGTLGR
jgi:hypothetical protein